MKPEQLTSANRMVNPEGLRLAKPASYLLGLHHIEELSRMQAKVPTNKEQSYSL